MAKTKRYGTCEANIQDEFPGFGRPGKLVLGTITQVERLHAGDAGEVVAWFEDSELAERVVALLNKAG